MPPSVYSTPYEAAHGFGDTLQTLISCVVHGKVTILGVARPELLCSAVLNDGAPAALRGEQRLWLWMTHNYRAVPIDGNPANGWTVSSVAYYYAFTSSEQQKPEIIAFHWHPGDEGAFVRPHLHVGAAWLGRDAAFSPHWHIPTGRVALEHVLQLAIREFGIQPIEEEYEILFEEALAQFQQDHSRAVEPH